MSLEKERPPFGEPPYNSSSSAETSTTCIYDLFFDVPHPSASPTCERAKIIEPPGRTHPVISELYDPSNISRIAMFAFPDYDEHLDSDKHHTYDSTSAILNKYDVCCFSSRSINHTFSLLLDSGTRVHAHVLRYLPIHSAIQTRYDVGRRGERAMVLVTRSVGGFRFYTSLLKTLQAIGMEEIALPPNYMGDHDLVKAFLHSIYKKHLLLKKKYIEKTMRHGFQKVLNDDNMRITILGAELYFLLPVAAKDNNGGGNGSYYFLKQDYISFQLPNTLQPGYNKSDFAYECEDLYSPILPLIRCLGAAKTIRVLSALLCEHRIIFVSKSIEILSACVSSCTAMLAQGMLIWRHVQIPVIPPHLLRYLSTAAPFIVGVLDRYSERIERMPGLKDALYIDLDNGTLKTLYMEDAHKKIPDLLLRKKRKNSSAIEELVNDFTSVLESEHESWELIGEKAIEDTKEAVTVDTKKKTFSEKLGITKRSTISKKEEKRSWDFFQQAEVFVKNILPQPSFSTLTQKNDFSNDVEKVIDRNSGKDEPTLRFRACVLNDNERGEEIARASLVSFFLELFGDMGMYLTVDRESGSFCLDVKKFLLRKRQIGAREDTAMYLLLQHLTRSIMFERFTQGRITDIEQAAKNQHVPINHTPLFLLCQKHMRMHRTKFTTPNIRKVVFTTISACPERRHVDTREEVKQRALALTSEKPFEGDEVVALTTLIDICKGCDQSFSQVMQVIWLRIREDRPTLWKHPLLGLHLLRNFLLHGPITTLSSSLGELERIRTLMEYKGRVEDIGQKVQTAARQVYALLKNLCRLFLRRRKVVTLKIKKATTISDNVRWSSYLIRRLPPTVKFTQLHDLMRPCDEAIPMKNIIKQEDDITVIKAKVALKEGTRGSTGSDDIPFDLNPEKINVTHENGNAVTRRPSLDNQSKKVGLDHTLYDDTPYVNMKAKHIERARKTNFEDLRQENQRNPQTAEEKKDAMSIKEFSKENLINRKVNQNGKQSTSYRASYGGVEGMSYETGFEEVKL